MQNQGKNQKPPKTEPPISEFREYLYANFLFWVFLLVLAVTSFFICGGVWDDVTSGIMEFLFVILGGGFAVVSVLDYLYEKYTGQTKPEGQQ